VKRSAALAVLILASAVPGPAAADSMPTQLATAFANWAGASSFHVTVVAHGQEADIDYVKPGKMHATAHGGKLELIRIGGDTYVKTGSSWRKISFPGLDSITDPVAKANDYVTAHHDSLSVKDLGMTTVNGESLHEYAVLRASSSKSPSNFYVGSDNLVHEITQHTRFGTITITVTKYNAPLTIEAPAT